MTNPLNSIREGMHVKDSAGHEIGHVAHVKLSEEDPDTPYAERTTIDGEGQRERTFIDDLGKIFADDGLPEQLRMELMRKGFIRLDTKGLLASDRYILPEQIERVSDDTVSLRVNKDDLVKRH